VGIEARPIYIAIMDPRTMIRVSRALRELDAEPKGIYREGSRIYGVALADREGLRYLERARVKVVGTLIRVSPSEDPMCIALRAIVASLGVSDPSPLIVGIDLGDNIGVALIAGRAVVFAKSVRNHYRALDLVCSSLRCVESQRKIVRVGIPRKECPEYEKLVESLARALDEDVELELVPEARSSKLRSYIGGLGKLSKDARAAINIALARLEA